MLVVRLEVWPGGDPAGAREVGVMRIANQLTGNEELGDYTVEIDHCGDFYGKPGVWKQGRVHGHPRKKLSPFHLVLSALQNALSTYRSAARSSSAPAAPAGSSSRAVRGRAACRGCGAPIVFITTPAGKITPADAEPINVTLDDAGELKVLLEDGRVVSARRHGPTDLYEPTQARLSHFASCPQAANFRRSSQGGADRG